MSTTDDEYTSEWRHTSVETLLGIDCAAFVTGNDALLLYDPTSDTAETYVSAADPVDLREWA